jgi:hypothetical protein
MTITIDPLVGIATLVMAGGLIWIGYCQFGALKDQLINQLKISQQQMKTIIERGYATLLPSIDDRYECREMQESRNIEQKLLDRAKGECASLTGKTFEQKLCSCFLNYVIDLRDKDHAQYLILMRKINFFETVGYLCKKSYLSYDDVIELYSMPITRAYLLLLPHIQDRQSKEGSKIYEFFVELGKKAVKKYPDYDLSKSTS